MMELPVMLPAISASKLPLQAALPGQRAKLSTVALAMVVVLAMVVLVVGRHKPGTEEKRRLLFLQRKQQILPAARPWIKGSQPWNRPPKLWALWRP